MQDYFQQELGIQVIHDNATIHIGQISMLVGHGDELGGSFSYRLLKKYIYKNSLLYTIAKVLPSTFLFTLQKYVPKLSHKKFSGPDIYLPSIDGIFQSCKEKIEPYQHHDYYIFGHLHFPYSKSIHEHSTYYNVGDWLKNFSYGVFDGEKFAIKKYNQ